MDARVSPFSTSREEHQAPERSPQHITETDETLMWRLGLTWVGRFARDVTEARKDDNGSQAEEPDGEHPHDLPSRTHCPPVLAIEALSTIGGDARVPEGSVVP